MNSEFLTDKNSLSYWPKKIVQTLKHLTGACSLTHFMHNVLKRWNFCRHLMVKLSDLKMTKSYFPYATLVHVNVLFPSEITKYRPILRALFDVNL